MIEILRVHDKEDEERQASPRPDQLADLRIVPLNCGCKDNDRQTNSQDYSTEFAAHDFVPHLLSGNAIIVYCPWPRKTAQLFAEV
jgi:hypothetical protein